MTTPQEFEDIQIPDPDLSSRLSKVAGSSRLQIFLSLLVLISATVLLVWMSWEKWGDTIVDTGRELYIPWQLSEGKVLYRDVTVNQYGPLSSYVNAALFSIFGVHFMALHIFNILLTMSIAAYIYRIFFKVSGVFAATVTVLVFVVLFAFSDITSMGIFNFVSPYAYAVTYSLALSLGAHYFLNKYDRSKSILDILLAGVWLGLVFLCKYEAFVAMTVCLIVGICLIFRSDKLPIRKTAEILCAAFTGFVVPILGFLAYFSFYMPVKQSFSSVMLQYRQIFDTRVANNNFYRGVTGTVNIKESLGVMILSLTVYLALVTLAFFFAFLILKLSRRFLRIAAGLAIISGFSAAMTWHALNESFLWLTIPLRALPIVLLAAVGTCFYQILKKKNSLSFEKSKPLFMFTLFSLGFLAKIFLNTHAEHYGFVLAMPATLVGVWLLIDYFPKYVDLRLPGARWLVASVGLIFIYGILLSHLNLSSFSYAQKQMPIGAGNDRLITWHPGANTVYWSSYISTRERGVRFKETLDELERILKPDNTLLVMPEGALFNYLTRHKNPTPYTSFLLGDLIMFDESKILADLNQHPPDYIVLADRDLRVYGCNSFGLDSGRRIMNWVNQNYRVIREIGPPPFRNLGFGTRILRRLPTARNAAVLEITRDKSDKFS